MRRHLLLSLNLYVAGLGAEVPKLEKVGDGRRSQVPILQTTYADCHTKDWERAATLVADSHLPSDLKSVGCIMHAIPNCISDSRFTSWGCRSSTHWARPIPATASP